MTENPLILTLNGDSGSVYTVTLIGHPEGRVSLRCSCPAGKKGILCKHLRNLLAGDFKRVVVGEAAQMEFASRLASSPLPRVTSPLLQRLSAAEKEQEALKKEISNLKKDILGCLTAATMKRDTGKP